MSFSLEQSGTTLVIEVEGQLVVSNRQEFKQAVLDAIEQGARLVVVDCARAGYIDSSGLGALVSLAKRVRELGGDLRLAGLNADLRALFELTRLDALFPHHATRRDALAAP
jgi:anti-sigma B factor antagonist